MSQPTHIAIRQVEKVFGPKTALRDISVDIAPGTFVVLLGPSGSGKTTLLRCLAGIERPTSGEILFNDEVVVGASTFVSPDRRHLSMVFQDYALWPHLTVSQNVAFALQRRGSNRDQIAEKVSALLHRLGIDQLASRFPNELSGGEQQRVALARALAAEVGLILFDEPLSNLDADRRESLRIEIATLARESGATVVYITHDQSEAYALADVIGVLSAGTLVQWGTPENVYREPATPFVARFTGLAGELPVHVEHRRDGRADVTLLLDTPVVVRDCPTNTTVGDDATMFVRPSAVQLHHSASGSGFWMNITDSAFVGRGYEHVGVTDGEIRFTKIFSTERFERGSRAWVTLDTQAVYVMNERSA